MIVIVGGRNRPHEMFLFGASIVLALSSLVEVPPPRSLVALLPGWFVAIWTGGLLLSGIAGLVACLWPNVIVSLALERGALLMSAGAVILIGAAALIVNGKSAVVGAGFFLTWALANLVRVRQVTKDLRRIAVALGEDSDG